MGVFDLFTIIVAAVGYAIGRNRGLVWQLSGIVTLVVGGLTATVLSTPAGPLFAEGMLGRFVAWVAIYIVVGVCLYVLTLRLKDKIKEMEFEELDKRFGGMLGGFKAVCIFALVVLVAVAISDNVGEAVKDSATGRTLGFLVHEAHPLVPDKIHDAFDRIHPREERPPDSTDPKPILPPTTPTQSPVPTTPTQPTQPPPEQPLQPTTDTTPRPNPFESPEPTPPTIPSDVEPLEPSAEINVPEIQPLPPEDDDPDPFDTAPDDDDPLAPQRE